MRHGRRENPALFFSRTDPLPDESRKRRFLIRIKEPRHDTTARPRRLLGYSPTERGTLSDDSSLGDKICPLEGTPTTTTHRSGRSSSLATC